MWHPQSQTAGSARTNICIQEYKETFETASGDMLKYCFISTTAIFYLYFRELHGNFRLEHARERIRRAMLPTPDSNAFQALETESSRTRPSSPERSGVRRRLANQTLDIAETLNPGSALVALPGDEAARRPCPLVRSHNVPS